MRPTLDELEKREVAGRAEKCEAAGRVSYHVEISVSQVGPSLAECEIVRMVNGKRVSVLGEDGTIGYTYKTDQTDVDRFIVRGSAWGDLKRTLEIALLAAAERVAGRASPKVVG